MSRTELERELPSTVTGEIRPKENTAPVDVQKDMSYTKDIPVVFETEEVTLGTCKEYLFDDDWSDEVPGACKFNVGSGISSGAGTPCTPAWDPQAEERVMITAGHVLDNYGSKVFQPGGGYNSIYDSDGRIGEYQYDGGGEDHGYIRHQHRTSQEASHGINIG